MAGVSECSRQLKELKLLDTSCPNRGSDESEYLTATGIEVHPATTTSWSFSCARNDGTAEASWESGEGSSNSCLVEEQIERSKAHLRMVADESGGIEEGDELDYGTAPASDGVEATTSSSCFACAVEEQIERSKAHWSELADQSSGVEGYEVAEVSNVEEFKALQMHPVWGGFFQTFGYNLGGRYGNMGELVIGEKFAEGGQAELYEAQVKWINPKDNEDDLKEGCEWVLKVFKKGTFLKHLKSQLPQGYLQYYAEEFENWTSPSPVLLPRYQCTILHGILLKDGRFAFLMQKEDFDLRDLIERNMKLRSSKDCGPFSKEEGEYLMYRVALGVDWLHSRDIIHRDLKASNVLVKEYQSGWPKWYCFVADYECSVGVVGTGFFRAPEILQACKDRKVSERPEVFSRAADVYSYGMICYEILAGKLPFENHPLSVPLLTDLVINQDLRPEVPEYVVDWTRELLGRCWRSNPIARPTIGEILNLLSANSMKVRRVENRLKREFGENFRSNEMLTYGREFSDCQGGVESAVSSRLRCVFGGMFD